MITLEAIDCPNCGRLLDPAEPSCYRCHQAQHQPAPEVPAWLVERCCWSWLAVSEFDSGIYRAVERASSGELHDLRTWVALDAMARAQRNGITVGAQLRRMVQHG